MQREGCPLLEHCRCDVLITLVNRKHNPRVACRQSAERLEEEYVRVLVGTLNPIWEGIKCVGVSLSGPVRKHRAADIV